MKIVVNFLSIFLYLFFVCTSSNACINEYRSLLSGRIIYSDAESSYAPFPRFEEKDTIKLQNMLHELDSIYKETKQISDYSDYGAVLTYLGRYSEAKSLFLDIEKRDPNRYATATNLGTVYELLGQNDSALIWIEKGLKLNPNSHDGSEWIHVAILKAKIHSKGNILVLKNMNILNLDFGNDEKPVFKDSIDLHEVRKQLFIQLCERMTFVKPKDPVVAQLLFDLANITAIDVDVKSAKEIYQLAKDYGYDKPILKKRLSTMDSLQEKADRKNSMPSLNSIYYYFWLIGFILFGVVIVVTLYLKFRGNKK